MALVVRNGPNASDLVLALMEPRGRMVTFVTHDESYRCYVGSIDNLVGDGTFGIRGFLAGGDQSYFVKYTPATGQGIFGFGQCPF